MRAASSVSWSSTRGWARHVPVRCPAAAGDRDLSHARAAGPARGAGAVTARSRRSRTRSPASASSMTARVRARHRPQAARRTHRTGRDAGGRQRRQSGYRFGASRAYDGIVAAAPGRDPRGRRRGLAHLADFLARRMAPAMRTCTMLEERQAKLSEKLSRARQPAADAGRRGDRAPEPRPAQRDERPRAHAAAAAADGRGPVGRGDQLLRRRAWRATSSRGRRTRLDPAVGRRAWRRPSMVPLAILGVASSSAASEKRAAKRPSATASELSSSCRRVELLEIRRDVVDLGCRW